MEGLEVVVMVIWFYFKLYFDKLQFKVAGGVIL